MVTQIGLGLAALGRPAYINIGRTEDLGGDRSVEALERRCHEMLDAAYKSGVRYVDAARRIINLPSVAQTPAKYWTRRSTLSWQ